MVSTWLNLTVGSSVFEDGVLVDVCGRLLGRTCLGFWSIRIKGRQKCVVGKGVTHPGVVNRHLKMYHLKPLSLFPLSSCHTASSVRDDARPSTPALMSQICMGDVL